MFRLHPIASKLALVDRYFALQLDLMWSDPEDIETWATSQVCYTLLWMLFCGCHLLWTPADYLHFHASFCILCGEPLFSISEHSVVPATCSDTKSRPRYARLFAIFGASTSSLKRAGRIHRSSFDVILVRFSRISFFGFGTSSTTRKLANSTELPNIRLPFARSSVGDSFATSMICSSSAERTSSC